MPTKNQKGRVKVEKNGPYLVTDGLPLNKERVKPDENGNPKKFVEGETLPTGETYALCRCGSSGRKPFCDGSHAKNGFDGTETASMESYEKMAEIINGPGLDLADAAQLCAASRFCHRGGGAWNLTTASNDPKAVKLAVEEACRCPSGRLTTIDKKTGKPIEPELKPSLSLIEDVPAGVSGPIRVKGGVPVESADGREYPIRNRVTLCRCGQSKNKPCCDGSHIEAGFNDGDESLK